MKKKVPVWKIVLAVATAAVFAVVLYFALAFFGNPVSKMLCRISAEKYVEENYPDCYIDRVGYNFKDGNFFANIKKDGSVDTNFYVYTDWFGNIGYDAYESYVSSGHNTQTRMFMEYRALLDDALPQKNVDYTLDIFFGDIVHEGIYEKYAYETYTGKIAGMPQEELVLDKEYDYYDIGYRYGHVTLYALHEEVSLEKACEILLDVKEKLNGKGLGFYSIDFVLQKPRKRDGTPSDDEARINVNYFLWDDIYEEGLKDRVQTAHESLEKYYAEEDAKKNEFLGQVHNDWLENRGE